MNSLAPLEAKLADERVLGWQTRLHRWAVQDERVRFGDLFNLVCDPATLLAAWERVKRNRGSKTAGVDGETRKRIEAIGVEKVLGELRQSLRDRTYVPLPVREQEIPKPHGGGVRTLGVPTVADRVAQTVVAMYLGERAEPRFHSDSYGYRPERSGHDALEVCRRRCWEYDWVIDLDVQKFFDTVPWDLVIKAVQAITDVRWVLLYVTRWLAAPLQHPDGTIEQRVKGTPQGSLCAAAHKPPYEQRWVMRSAGVEPLLRLGLTAERCA